MKTFGPLQLPTRLMLAGLLLIGMSPLAVGAASQLSPVVIDDFEDGDTSDWIFFGSGGGGAADDRPQEGSYYLSTGWGGAGGTGDGSFYGGAFRNFDNSAQVNLPADPWFNVWVLNQSDATADQYKLEITLREDEGGDGWDGDPSTGATNVLDDSVQLVTTFISSQFDDQWMLISAPLSSFTNLGAGGNGTFEGELDEVVIVIGGVLGADPSIVEVDFDQLSFTSDGPPATVFDDMEHGNPFGNGWFTFPGGPGTGGGIGPNTVDLPPSDGGAFSLETGWGGGALGFFGGFGRTNPVDLSGTDHFSFWINPDVGQDYTLEINLQDDDDGDGAIPPNSPDDDEFQYNCVVSPAGPCADSDEGWQLVSIPLADFFDDNGGGNGVLDAVATGNGGNGQLINVVFAVISNSGADVNFRTDYWAFSDFPDIVDDFETPLPIGSDPLGFFTFNSAGSSISIATTPTPPTPPSPVPDSSSPNDVLELAGTVGGSNGFAGFIHGFANAALDTPAPQDWSSFEGLSLWFYGQGTGAVVFVDVLDNRNPGSMVDDAERFSVEFIDDFTGWRHLAFPFASFIRKEVGNGAPNDGFGLSQIHGYAVGFFNGPPAAVTAEHYVDEVALWGVGEIPELAVNFAEGSFDIEEGTTGTITVKLNRPIGPDDEPDDVSVYFTTEKGSAMPGLEYTPVEGTLTFSRGGPTEQTFELETFDDSKFEGDERVILKLTNPVDVVTGTGYTAAAAIIDNDPYDPDLLDDFEKEDPYLWDSSANVDLSNLKIPGQEEDPFEGVLLAEGPQNVEITWSGKPCKPPKSAKSDKSDKSNKSEKSKKSDKSNKSHKSDKSKKSEKSGKSKKSKKSAKSDNSKIKVVLYSTDDFDATTVDHTTVMLGDAYEIHVDKKTGLPKRHEKDVDKDGRTDLVFHFRAGEAGVDCTGDVVPFNGLTWDDKPFTAGGSGAAFGEDFALGRDWSKGEALTFLFYGSGSGLPVTVELKDNRATDPGPAGWSLVWSEEFNEPVDTLPNPQNWSYEIGDGTVNGIPGWGNDELQYYTDDPENAATDGKGNMVITLREADGSLDCYYGPCEYTSARLITQHKAEFAYGRIESRILVPDGGAGLWPAFWSLGTDITYNPWPAAGEIDFMEYVSRLADEIFGTIHGPGYNGGGAFGNIYDFGEPVYNNYHTFTVEWQPNLITWYVDDIQYHQATQADVDPFGPWVFKKPFFLLLNFAIGGNFGGAIDPANTYPQEYKVDYIRVFQGPDTAERFETTFVDDFDGWQEVDIPLSEFSRSAEQPAGAPNDGLTLAEVWGYGFKLPQGSAGGKAMIDQVRLDVPPPPPNPIFDDFEDGEAFDWGFFGGNNEAGGGGARVGPDADDAAEGSFHFSTGWGGKGSDSGFYGGTFKNADNMAQATPPADPYINVWVRNESTTTVEEYTLEITIREDLDGNGWENGAEDSFRFDIVFTTADFNDKWVLLSAPLSGLTDLFTGGDGTFDGKLDEVVIVIASVIGANPSDVQVDFDQIAFSSGGPIPVSP